MPLGHSSAKLTVIPPPPAPHACTSDAPQRARVGGGVGRAGRSLAARAQPAGARGDARVPAGRLGDGRHGGAGDGGPAAGHPGAGHAVREAEGGLAPGGGTVGELC